MTITEFLEARIAEDEADAINRVVLPFTDRRGLSDSDAERIHAECAAKRALMKAGVELEDSRSDANLWSMDSPDDVIMRILAAIYKDHPDYQQEWA